MHGAVVVCTYIDTAGLSAPPVSVHVDTASDPARFAASRAAFVADGERTRALSGLGAEAFTSTVESDKRVIATVVARSGAIQLWVTAASPVASVEELSRQVLSRL